LCHGHENYPNKQQNDGLSLNPKHKIMDQNKNSKAKTKNTKCAKPKYK